MRRLFVTTVAVLPVLLALPSAAQQPSSGDAELDTILITGEQPGPGLWKVSKGDHVLWILPSLDPLGSRMVWRTDEAEARIAESQQVLYPPNLQIEPSVGFFQVLNLIPAIPAAMKAGNNPDGAKLKDVLPAESFAQWRAMRDKYYVSFGKKSDPEDVEKRRPAVAISMLRGWAYAKSGLSNRRVDGFVMHTATKHQVPVNHLPTIVRAVKLEKNIRGMLKEAARAPPAELECFQRVLENLEPAIELAAERANAWARGDIARLRALHRDQQPRDDCIYTTMFALADGDSKNAARARKMLDSFVWHEEQGRVQAQRDWVAAAMLSLEKNASTFAALRVEDIFGADGHVETLRGLGYTVEEPQ